MHRHLSYAHHKRVCGSYAIAIETSQRGEREREREKFNVRFLLSSRDLYMHKIKGQGGPEAHGP